MIPGDKTVISNNDTNPINLDNSLVIDGYGGNELERYVQYVDGYNLAVDYYSFIAMNNTEKTLLDPGDSTQQYSLVKQLILKTKSPLPTGNYETLSFDAILDANLVPAKNDMVVINLPNGIVGIFHVYDIAKKTYIEKTIYDVNIKFLYFKKNSINYYNSLVSKVKKTFYYDKDYVLTNSSPIILENTYRTRIDLRTKYSSLLDYFLDNFVNEKVISLTNDGLNYYDRNIEKLFYHIISSTDNHKILKLKYLEIPVTDSTIVDLIVNRNMFTVVNKYYALNQLIYDGNNEETISLISSNINYRVVTSDTPTDSLKVVKPDSTIIPNVFRSMIENEYIFSNNFYSNSENISLLEDCIKDYINKSIIRIETHLEVILNDIVNWSNIEQYYYIPMTLLILKYAEINSYDRI